MEQAIIGFGGNLGESARTCREAVETLRRHPRIDVEKVSSLYRTEPVGVVDQDWFVNGVILCRTTLEPMDLLDVTARIEDDFGRVRRIRWGPRSLDLDILCYGERIIDLPPRLEIPHPRMHERSFVLLPLMEIAPHWAHPVLGKTAQELWAELSAGPGATDARVLEES
jgi:2-amino-4-hydroxy-6-hydroxymethyldihydropteridine diphosphokinase